MKNLTTLLLLLITTCIYAQVPSTNIYLFDYLNTDEGKVILQDPRIITADNINGYNNQPHWHDDKLYITRQKEGADQTEIVVLDISAKQESSFTKTRQSEYSPTITPDGNHLSCIRVEDDGTQVLWKYPLDKSHGGERILKHIKDIGYHHWLNDTEVLLFIVDEPMKLILANTDNEETTRITSKIGRCFGQMSNGEILYVYKYTESIWHLKAYIPTTGRSRFVAETIQGGEDFVILPNDAIVMGSGSKLYRNTAPFTSWEEIADLKTYDIDDISRLSVSGKILTVVAQ